MLESPSSMALVSGEGLLVIYGREMELDMGANKGGQAQAL